MGKGKKERKKKEGKRKMTKNFDVRQKLNCINVTSSQVSTRGGFALLKRRLQLVYEHPESKEAGNKEGARERFQSRLPIAR